MSRDPSGFYTLPPPPLNPVVGGTPITSMWGNTTLGDIAAALTDSLSRSGKGGMAAPLVMNGYKITSVGFATAATDVPQAQQVRDSYPHGLSNVAVDASGNNYVTTANLSAPINEGTTFILPVTSTNTGPMTISVNGSAALPILVNGAAIPPGLIQFGAIITVIHHNAAFYVMGVVGGTGSTVNSVVSADAQLISVVNTAGVATLTPHANVAFGMVKLDSGNKVPPTLLPFTDIHYVGIWNATPGTNPSTSGLANGDFYIITVAGTLTLYRDSGSNTYTAQSTAVVVGDAIILRAGSANPSQPDGWYFDPGAARPAVASTVSMTETSATPPFGGITNAQTWMVTADAEIRNKLPLAGGTMSGPIVQPALPSAASHLANKQYVDGQVAGAGGVSSFNGRTGAVTLGAPDVTGALGYTPMNEAGGTFTGHIVGTTAVFTGGMRSLYYVPYLFIATIGGTSTLSMFNGQIQNLGLVADLILTSIDNMVGGGAMRIVFNATNLHTVTWPANVYWPLGVVPNLAAGPNGVAVVELLYTGGGSGSGMPGGGTILGDARMY